jgi:hypothetical protein
MSLSAREQQALDTIHKELAKSDPQLMAMLATFTQLVSNEDMPTRETIHQRSWRAIRYSWCRRDGPRSAADRRGPPWQRLGFRRAVLVVYLLITAGLIVTGVILSRESSHRECPSLWAVPCASPAPVHSSRPAAHQNAG